MEVRIEEAREGDALSRVVWRDIAKGRERKIDMFWVIRATFRFRFMRFIKVRGGFLWNFRVQNGG